MSFLSSVAPALSVIPGWGPAAAAGASLLGGMIGGGGQSAGNQGAGQVGNYYQNALGQLVNATGSPAAAQFGQLEQNALKPQFAAQDSLLGAKEAAMGITGSGASRADFSNLAGNQASTLAQAVAPLYSQAMGQYGQILGAQPGAQADAYQTALSQYNQSQGGIGQLIGQQGGMGQLSQALGGLFNKGGAPNPYAPGTSDIYGMAPNPLPTSAPGVDPGNYQNITPINYGG